MELKMTHKFDLNKKKKKKTLIQLGHLSEESRLCTKLYYKTKG